ncbi:uncharacterized protein LOC130630560 [Hydractinia symbiolongicarpus]|uniref:uncharacterized protein LOC130630560 n=1 Tax=Hydractinia symbiolongicarpus TaxID=13093 RepID=UPI00254B56DE|nr:uncharacterized protein LOC130630560 [Hydractinia symbiolongicarpus]
MTGTCIKQIKSTSALTTATTKVYAAAAAAVVSPQEEPSPLRRYMTKQEAEILRRNSTSDLEREFMNYIEMQQHDGHGIHKYGPMHRNDAIDEHGTNGRFALPSPTVQRYPNHSYMEPRSPIMSHNYRTPVTQGNMTIMTNMPFIKEEPDTSPVACGMSKESIKIKKTGEF